jgi:hypothetical protein
MERAYGLEIPQNLVEACNPRRTAFLVYDMQVGIIGQIQGGQELARVACLPCAAHLGRRADDSQRSRWRTG